jgi:hypothetical protein
MWSLRPLRKQGEAISFYESYYFGQIERDCFGACCLPPIVPPRGRGAGEASGLLAMTFRVCKFLKSFLEHDTRGHVILRCA